MHQVCVQTIYVTDLKRAVNFYEAGLGYEIEAEYGDYIVQLKTEGITLILQEVQGDDSIPSEPKTVLAFQTDDILGSITTLKASGARILHNEPQPCPVGRYVTFEDPTGIMHELLEFCKG